MWNGLRGHNGMVKRLTTFSLGTAHDQTQPSHLDVEQAVLPYNIVLEYGEMDLDDYFHDRNPPFYGPEILAFYEGLFKVVGPVETIHNLETTDSGRSYQG